MLQDSAAPSKFCISGQVLKSGILHTVQLLCTVVKLNPSLFESALTTGTLTLAVVHLLLLSWCLPPPPLFDASCSWVDASPTKYLQLLVPQLSLRWVLLSWCLPSPSLFDAAATAYPLTVAKLTIALSSVTVLQVLKPSSIPENSWVHYYFLWHDLGSLGQWLLVVEEHSLVQGLPLPDISVLRIEFWTWYSALSSVVLLQVSKRDVDMEYCTLFSYPAVSL